MSTMKIVIVTCRTNFITGEGLLETYRNAKIPPIAVLSFERPSCLPGRRP